MTPAAEVLWWKRDAGGEVFHVGSIATGWSLSSDVVMRTIVARALEEFGV